MEKRQIHTVETELFKAELLETPDCRENSSQYNQHLCWIYI